LQRKFAESKLLTFFGFAFLAWFATPTNRNANLASHRFRFSRVAIVIAIVANLLDRGLLRLEPVHETASELHGDIHRRNRQHQADHHFHAYGELYGGEIVFGEIHRMKS